MSRASTKTTLLEMSLFLGDARDELKCHSMHCLQSDGYERQGMDGPVMYYHYQPIILTGTEVSTDFVQDASSELYCYHSIAGSNNVEWENDVHLDTGLR